MNTIDPILNQLIELNSNIKRLTDRVSPNPLVDLSVNFNPSTPTIQSVRLAGSPFNWILNGLITGVINVYFAPITPTSQTVPNFQLRAGSNSPTPIPMMDTSVDALYFQVDPNTPNNTPFGTIRIGHF